MNQSIDRYQLFEIIRTIGGVTLAQLGCYYSLEYAQIKYERMNNLKHSHWQQHGALWFAHNEDRGMMALIVTVPTAPADDTPAADSQP